MMVLLIVTLISLAISTRDTKNERNVKLNAGISILGGILAIIDPIVYYFYLDTEIPTLFWDQFLPFIGVFLSLLYITEIGVIDKIFFI